MHRGLAVLVAMLAAVAPASAARQFRATSFEKSAFTSFQRSFRDLQGRLAGNGVQVGDFDLMARRSEENLRYLNRLRDQYDVPIEYVESMNGLHALVAVRLQQAQLGRESVETLREVDADLETKSQCARKRLASTGDNPPFDLINVTVHTTSSGTEVGGCEVWTVLRGWADSELHYVRFDRLSSPTTVTLAPGNYFFWARRDGTNSTRFKSNLGENGELERAVDLEAP